MVVDANDESDELSALIGRRETGLFELLSHPEMDPMDVALTRPRWPAVIGSGAIGSSTLVDPDAARKLIEKLNEHFDIVVIASAPIHLSGHALVWAKAARSLSCSPSSAIAPSATTWFTPWRTWRAWKRPSSARFS